MLTSRRLAPLSLALCLAVSSGAAYAAPAAPAQKGESAVKSFRQAFKAGVDAYKERRAAAGPGLLRRNMQRLGKALGAGAAMTAEGIKNGKHAVVRGTKNSLLGRMTIGVVDSLKVGGRLVARPFKALANAVRQEKAAVKQARLDKALKKTESMDLMDLTKAERSGAISRRTMQSVVDHRVANPQSRDAVIASQLTNNSKLGLKELEEMAERGEISHELKNKVIDDRMAKPVSRASLE